MSHWNDEPNESPKPVETGLEMWARRLDEQHYPGRAWPPATRPCSQPPPRLRGGWIATCVAAAALMFAVTLRVARRPVVPGRPPDAAQDGRPAPAGDDVPFPPVFVVEDGESYSIITVTDELAVVSFATKGGFGPEWLVALPAHEKAGGR